MIVNFLKRLATNEDGATMVEYAMMVALIGAALVTVVADLSAAISAQFNSISNTLSGS